MNHVYVLVRRFCDAFRRVWQVLDHKHVAVDVLKIISLFSNKNGRGNQRMATPAREGEGHSTGRRRVAGAAELVEE